MNSYSLKSPWTYFSLPVPPSNNVLIEHWTVAPPVAPGGGGTNSRVCSTSTSSSWRTHTTHCSNSSDTASHSDWNWHTHISVGWFLKGVMFLFFLLKTVLKCMTPLYLAISSACDASFSSTVSNQCSQQGSGSVVGLNTCSADLLPPGGDWLCVPWLLDCT